MNKKRLCATCILAQEILDCDLQCNAALKHVFASNVVLALWSNSTLHNGVRSRYVNVQYGSSTVQTKSELQDQYVDSHQPMPGIQTFCYSITLAAVSISISLATAIMSTGFLPVGRPSGIHDQDHPGHLCHSSSSAPLQRPAQACCAC